MIMAKQKYLDLSNPNNWKNLSEFRRWESLFVSKNKNKKAKRAAKFKREKKANG